MLHLKTKRLYLIPCSQEVALAAITDKALVEKLLEVRVPSDWPGSETQEALPFFAQLASDPLQLGWGAWWMILTAEQTLIGGLGFLGKPDREGKVEMGYSVLEAYRKQGYAFEAVQALVDWAFKQPSLKRIIAHCDNDNDPSILILEKLGMKCLENNQNLLKWELAPEYCHFS